MRILLTNDDGIHDEGIAALERIARQLSDDVWVVAPETDQSGLAHSLTLNQPLRLRKADDRHYAVRGTPTDCVIMAVRHLMPEPPDLVLSGVNSGTNIADDVTYSGTVAGAIEGTLMGIRSIAVSQAYSFEDERRIVPYEVAETHAPALFEKLIAADLPKGVFVNVNLPNCLPEEVKGTRVTRQGKLSHRMTIDKRADGRGFPYYWLRFQGHVYGDIAGSDIEAVRDNFISVTPLQLDLTADAAIAALSGALA
ncbi:MAG: 5'/3'-nucleotidase SurE [Phyllobacteriaceae bacterium]|nr:5'/3'-nucleotidase SurE [Phyllobacteriaceae bacterium]